MSQELVELRTPSLVNVLEAFVGQALEDVFVALPGIVESYDSETQTASVKPALKRPYTNIDGTEGADDLAIINDVPVLHWRGGGIFMSFPIEKGDMVLLVFCDNEIDEYVVSGGTGPVEPVSLRSHDISDAVAIPGFFTQVKKLKESLANDGIFGREKGPQVRVKEETVDVTSGGNESAEGGFVSMSEKCDDLWATMDKLFRTDWIVPPSPDAGAALKAAYLAAFPTPPSSVASTNLKAD